MCVQTSFFLHYFLQPKDLTLIVKGLFLQSAENTLNLLRGMSQ